MQLTITDAVILLRDGLTDLIYLNTNLPSPFPPEVDTSLLSLRFEATAGEGMAYIQKYLHTVPYRVIDTKNP